MKQVTLTTDFGTAGGLVFCGHRRVGKTVVAGGVAQALRQIGSRVAVFKPISLEAERSRTGRISHDAEMLAGCAESTEPLHQINPVALPGSVPIATGGNGDRSIEPRELIAIASGLQRDHDVLVVEGLDGLMCPYAPAFTELDLIRILNLVMVWVMPCVLGAIGPAMDALELARLRDVRIGGVVLNGDRLAAGDTETETLMDVLRQTAPAPVLTVVPWDASTSVANGLLGEEAAFALRQIDWLHILRTTALPLP